MYFQSGYIVDASANAVPAVVLSSLYNLVLSQLKISHNKLLSDKLIIPT